MTKIKRILCPVDFFPASIAAVKYAAHLAARSAAEIHLLHVITPVVATGPYDTPLPYVPEILESMRTDATRRMKGIEKKLTKARIKVKIHLKLGTVYDVIERAIRSMKPDLIVMGTHGRSGLRRWFLGSTTEKLLRHCRVPLLIGPPSQRRTGTPRFQRILVATDLSDGAPEALAYALSLGQAHKSHVTLLHVVHDLVADVCGDYRMALISGIRQRLDDLVRNHPGAIVTKVDTGRADRIIPWTLKAKKMDLLVISVNPKSLIDRVLVGSTAEEVVRSASCPVLVIPHALRRARMKAA